MVSSFLPKIGLCVMFFVFVCFMCYFQWLCCLCAVMAKLDVHHLNSDYLIKHPRIMMQYSRSCMRLSAKETVISNVNDAVKLYDNG